MCIQYFLFVYSNKAQLTYLCSYHESVGASMGATYVKMSNIKMSKSELSKDKIKEKATEIVLTYLAPIYIHL
jgi:hypothetical protein